MLLSIILRHNSINQYLRELVRKQADVCTTSVGTLETLMLRAWVSQDFTYNGDSGTYSLESSSVQPDEGDVELLSDRFNTLS